MTIKKIFFILMGIISIIIGVIGLLLPVFPTTPFLILASVFFAKGSDRFDRWLKNTKLYKNYAEDFVKEKSMTKQTKRKILLIADIMIAIPFVTVNNIYLRLGLLVLVSIKYYYFIFVIETKPETNVDEKRIWKYMLESFKNHWWEGNLMMDALEKKFKMLFSENEGIEDSIIDERMIEDLPSPIKLWLKNSGVVGHKRIKSVYLRQLGDMRLKPEKKWIKSDAEQYIIAHRPGFLWKVKMSMMPLMKVSGRDIFMEGKGRMQIKLGCLPVVNAGGNEKIDQSTLQRYLMELMWYPTEAVGEYITWEEIDDYSARAKMSYNGTSGSVVFYFNEKGEMTKCSAMRYKDSDEDAPLVECIGEVKENKVIDGLKIPTKVHISWVLDEGLFTWYKFELSDIKYDY